MNEKSKLFRLPNLYVLIIIALTYTAAHSWPIFSIAGLFMLMGALLPIVLAPQYFGSKIFRPLFLYLAVVGANVIVGDEFFNSNMKLAYEASYLLLPSSMLYYAITKEDGKTQKNIVVTFLVILILTTIATYFLCQIYLSAIRHGNTYTKEHGEDFYRGLYRFGFATYDMTHAVPCLVPILFYSWRQQQGRAIKAFLFLGLIACLFLSYLSGSFACLVLSFLSLIVSFFIKPGTLRTNFKSFILLGLIMLILLNDNIFINILSGLDNLFGNEGDFHEKFVDLQQTTISGQNQGDFAARNDLYNNSLNSFLNNILLGTSTASYGGHSAFLDRLGTLGLVGIIPYVIFLFRCISFAYSSLSQNCRVFYMLGVFISGSMLLSKGLSGWDVWLVLLFVLPSILIVFDKAELNPDK